MDATRSADASKGNGEAFRGARGWGVSDRGDTMSRTRTKPLQCSGPRRYALGACHSPNALKKGEDNALVAVKETCWLNAVAFLWLAFTRTTGQIIHKV